METEFQNAWQTAVQAEKDLLKTLADKEPTFAEIAHCLAEFRVACRNAIFVDFDAAATENAEIRLWDAHVKINARFRKLLARNDARRQFRDDAGKKKPVEKRKLEKHYLDFIKLSQKFYRGYIQHLSSHYTGIPELEQVAKKFSFENLIVDTPVNPGRDLRGRILQSCHATLIRLGDLSRYRETELVSGKERNWGPAIGYYDLASIIYPASGVSHNQLAVIALADGNHLRATYHLYRALSAQEPRPGSKGNLELEFKKVLSAWARRELIPREDAGIPGKALTPWFVYLHAQCYKGLDFQEHDELENEVLSQLAVDLKERSLEGTLQKFVLINIAAEELAKVRSESEPTHNAPLFLQRINVKTFFTLLQILLAELERFATEDYDSKESQHGSEKITVVARRVLPALRNYSSWLLTNYSSLTAQKRDKDTVLSVQIQEFWKIYANTLTLLSSTFDVKNIPEVEYLLEEDEETLGFQPLINEATSRRYLSENGMTKPRMLAPGIERNHPNIEMLYRIREFVIDGLDLVIYNEEGLPSQFYASPRGHQPTIASTNVQRDEISNVQPARNTTEGRSAFGGSQSASISASTNFNRIVEGVEKLVESDTYEAPPAMPQLPEFLRPTQPSSNVPYQTPMVPPGFGLQAPARSPTFAPFFTSSSIWSPSPPSLSHDVSQHRLDNTQALGPSSQISRGQDPYTLDTPSPSLAAFQSELSLQQKEMDGRSSTQFASTWTPQSISTPQPQLWGRSQFDSLPPYRTSLLQHSVQPPPGYDFPSSHNHAFIASTMSPPHASDSRQSTQDSSARFGAIGQQTSPCGQAG
uniref:Protein SMG7L n=1 Tax=Talaromyces marneffei PM1 TaxID=1077442 RepID=A0A093US81_TALMA